VVELDRPQMTLWRMRNACWIPKAANRHSEYNTYCFSTATMVERTRLDVTFYVQCLSCCILTKLTWWRHFTKLKHVARGNVKNCRQIKSCVREGNIVTCQFIEHWCPPVIRNYFCKTGLLSVCFLLSGAHTCTIFFEFCYCKVCNTQPSCTSYELPYFYTSYMMIYNTRTTFFSSASCTVAQQKFLVVFHCGNLQLRLQWCCKATNDAARSAVSVPRIPH
jgi:hypothetical protein